MQHAIQRNPLHIQFTRRLGDILLRASQRASKRQTLFLGAWQRARRRRRHGWHAILVGKSDQIGRRDNRAVADHDRATNDGHQFTHVPWPGVSA